MSTISSRFTAGSSSMICLLCFICCMGLLGLPEGALAAEQTQLSVSLNEAKVKHQFVVEGETSEFEVDLVLPDGTRLDHTVHAPEHFLYLGLENQKIWVLLEAPAGDYQLVVISEESQGFTASTKEAIQKPETTWVSPKQQTVQVNQAGASIPMSWQAGGEIRPGDQMRVYLQRQGTSAQREMRRIPLTAGSGELIIPSDLPDGEYVLTAEADNGTFEPQHIDPSVKVIVERGIEPLPLQVLGQFVEDGILYVDVAIDWYGWSELHAELVSSVGGETVMATAEAGQLVALAEDGTEGFRWAVTELSEDGDYTAVLYAVQASLAVSEATQLQPWVYKFKDGSDQKVEWSIEGERTGLRYMDVTVTVPEDSHLVLRTEHRLLVEHSISSAAGAETLQISLEEGDQLYELEIKDRYGNVHTYSKRLLVDHTPPRLEVIQPLPSHDRMPSGAVSGFVETGSTVKVDGVEVKVQEDGYFKVSAASSAINLTAEDTSGNVTQYRWEAKSAAPAWLWPLIINAGVVLVVAGVIWWLRRTRAH